MSWFVLVAWLIQSAVGVSLLVGWLRHGRRAAPAVVLHVALALVALALWVFFIATGNVLPAWIAFALITVGNGIGDWLLVRRAQRLPGPVPSNAYGAAIAAVFRGRMPRSVTFHALFAGVVYFSCLGVCLGASLT